MITTTTSSNAAGIVMLGDAFAEGASACLFSMEGRRLFFVAPAADAADKDPSNAAGIVMLGDAFAKGASACLFWTEGRRHFFFVAPTAAFKLEGLVGLVFLSTISPVRDFCFLFFFPVSLIRLSLSSFSACATAALLLGLDCRLERLDAARVDKPNSILLYFFEVARFFFGEEL